MEHSIPFEGVEIKRSAIVGKNIEKQVSLSLLLDTIRISFSEKRPRVVGKTDREKSRCCKIEWALLNIITAGDFHGWTSWNMLRNIHCSAIDLAQWRQEAGRRWLHPLGRNHSDMLRYVFEYDQLTWKILVSGTGILQFVNLLVNLGCNVKKIQNPC